MVGSITPGSYGVSMYFSDLSMISYSNSFKNQWVKENNMKITSFADYTLRTLMYLSVHQAERCTAKEIATFYNISLNHMVKVIHWLSTEGYIQSVKGKGGGVRLHKKPEQINLRKLFFA